MSGVARSIIINAPIEKAFSVISDFASYPEFLTEIKEVAVLNAGAKEVTAAFTLQLVKKINYKLKIKLAKPQLVSWKLISGDVMTQNNGSWKLKKIGGKKTEAKYSIDVKFGALVPGFISNMLVNNSLPNMLDAFKKRIEEKI